MLQVTRMRPGRVECMVAREKRDEQSTVAIVEHACDAGLVRAFEFLGKRWSGVILASLSTGSGRLRRAASWRRYHHRLGPL